MSKVLERQFFPRSDGPSRPHAMALWALLGALTGQPQRRLRTQWRRLARWAQRPDTAAWATYARSRSSAASPGARA